MLLSKNSWLLNLLTLTVHSPTKSNKGKWRKCAKSDYVIEAGLIWERNRCPGSDTRVACHGCTVHLVREAPGSKPRRGTPIFGPLPFRGDSLETKKGAWELGLLIKTIDCSDPYLKNCLAVAYLNFSFISEILGQFALRCRHYFSKTSWYFWDSTQNMLILSQEV